MLEVMFGRYCLHVYMWRICRMRASRTGKLFARLTARKEIPTCSMIDSSRWSQEQRLR